MEQAGFFLKKMSETYSVLKTFEVCFSEGKARDVVIVSS
jgi:hypothetical protein